MAHDELTRAAGEALTAARMKLGALTLTVELPATQPEIWRWITAPELLQQWSPVVPDRALTSLGAARSREDEHQPWADAAVTDVREPWFLEHRWGGETLSWQLAPSGDGTQLNLVHELSDQQQAAEMAADWHLSLTVLDRLLHGIATERCVGADALDHGWQQIRDHYAAQLAPQE